MLDWDLHDNEQLRKEAISDYLDGGLSEEDERCVDDHLSTCNECNAYLNSLKLVSTSLEIVLANGPVEVPGDFSRRVTVAAESDVGGLRNSSRGYRAVICASMLFFVSALVVAAGFSSSGRYVLEFSGKSFAYLGWIGHFVFKATTAFSMFFGTVCNKVLFGSTLAVSAVVVVLAISIFIFSKHIAQFHRS